MELDYITGQEQHENTTNFRLLSMQVIWGSQHMDTTTELHAVKSN